MEVEVGIPDNEPFEGEPSKWGAEEGTLVEELEEQVAHVLQNWIGPLQCHDFVVLPSSVFAARPKPLPRKFVSTSFPIYLLARQIRSL